MYDWRKMGERERREALAARLVTRRPWHGPPHEFKDERTYHVWAACYEHAPIIGAAALRIAAFECELLTVLGQCCEEIHAWSVLPNHYHILVTTPSLDLLTGSLGRLHGGTSFRWNGEDGARGRHVWHRCADRAMRTARHFWVTMNYVHDNPVHHGYVRKWEEWPFSSARDFLDAVGREEAKRIWRSYPLLDYGKGWDDPEM